MSLVDRRRLPLFPESWEAATSATFATSSKPPTVSADFSVATQLRHAATLPPRWRGAPTRAPIPFGLELPATEEVRDCNIR